MEWTAREIVEGWLQQRGLFWETPVVLDQRDLGELIEVIERGITKIVCAAVAGGEADGDRG